MDLLVDIPRAYIPPWRRGMLVRADHLNKMVDPLNRIIGGVEPPRQVRRARQAITQQFKIIANGIHDNHLRTHTWAGEDATEGAGIIEVARPWLLRVNPEEYSRNGITYTYVPNLPQERIASRIVDGVTETQTQVVVQRYRVGDIIYATQAIAGGLDGDWGPTLPFEWLDDNRDSRAWMKKYGTP